MVTFGNDVPANLAASIVLVDTPALDGQLQTLASNPVNFTLDGGDLVGRDSVSNAEVIRIALTGATLTNAATGEVTYGDDGYDLLSRIAVVVLTKDGEVIAARPDEITADIWNNTAVAGLRFPLS